MWRLDTPVRSLVKTPVTDIIITINGSIFLSLFPHFLRSGGPIHFVRCLGVTSEASRPGAVRTPFLISCCTQTLRTYRRVARARRGERVLEGHLGDKNGPACLLWAESVWYRGTAHPGRPDITRACVFRKPTSLITRSSRVPTHSS